MRKGYVTIQIKVPYHYDKEGMRKYEMHGISKLDTNGLLPLLCAGFDVDSSEDGQIMTDCNCPQCNISRQTEVEFLTEINVDKTAG